MLNTKINRPLLTQIRAVCKNAYLKSVLLLLLAVYAICITLSFYYRNYVYAI